MFCTRRERSTPGLLLGGEDQSEPVLGECTRVDKGSCRPRQEADFANEVVSRQGGLARLDSRVAKPWQS